jgi:type IV pilus assembly protein PilM
MLFFRKKQSFLGIDLGSTSIKLVELGLEKGVPTLLTYGYAERAMGNIVKGDPEKVQKKAVELLIKLHKKAQAKSYKAFTALPNFAVFTSVITLPVMSKKELVQAIHYEAKKFIPIPVSDTILDWKIIEEVKPLKTFKPSPEKEEKKSPEQIPVITPEKKMYRILLTAASKNLVKRYVEIFRLADIELLALETEAFSLARALIGRDPAVTMIIDFSAVTTDVIIIEKGIPILSRSIDVGGVTITRAIANILNIDFKRAEQFKRDVGLVGPGKIPEIIKETIRPIFEEIKYSLEIYQHQTGKTIEKIILSGGSTYLPNLAEYFTELLNTKVLIANPWARITYPEELKPALEEIAPRFSVAIGLALRGFE